MNNVQIIYKKDSKDKIRYIKLFTSGNKLIQQAGILGSEKYTEHIRECKAKNIGKSNETTPEEQAIKELEAKVKDKLQKEYFKTIEEAKNNIVIGAMLAKVYDKEKHKINWNSKDIFIQPKLDGVRCIAFKRGSDIKLMSRDYKPIKNMDHIIHKLQFLPDGIYDGELYIHGLSFQNIFSLISKYRKGETEKIQYHIYDIIDTIKSFKDRFIIPTYKGGYLKNIINENSIIRFVKCGLIKEENDILPITRTFVYTGYEGSIIRHGDNAYETNKRSSSLLKCKFFDDMICSLIDVLPSERNPLIGVPVLSYFNKATQKDYKFNSNIKCTVKEKMELLRNKENYIGKKVNLRYFGLTDGFIPRMPVVIQII